MRQWLIDPNLLCDRHLLVEHVEHHMFVGCILKNISLKGYIDTGLVEVHRLRERHDQLVEEMLKRNMKHKSPLPKFEGFIAGRVDVERNEKDLFERCERCRKRWMKKQEPFNKQNDFHMEQL